MEKSIVLDFYGLPGSGKSTISHQLAHVLSEDCIVDEPSYRMEHCHHPIVRKIMKIRESLFLLLLSPRKYLRLHSVLKVCGIRIWRREYYTNVFNLAYKINALNHHGQRVSIFDQGFCQAVTSLLFRNSDHVDSTLVYSELKKLIGQRRRMINVYVVADIGTVLLRMAHRHNNLSRIEKLEQSEQIEEMRRQMFIMENIPCDIRVDNNSNSVERCVEYLIKIVRGKE